MNAVYIQTEEIEEPLWLDAFEEYCLMVLKALGKDNWELSVLVCNDSVIRKLNLQYRRKDEPTDVLSFPLGELIEEGTRFLAGDIVISLDSLERNSMDFSVSMDEELRRLLVHGILHLDGFDHQSNEIEEPMLQKQEELLAAIAGKIIPAE